MMILVFQDLVDGKEWWDSIKLAIDDEGRWKESPTLDMMVKPTKDAIIKKVSEGQPFQLRAIFEDETIARGKHQFTRRVIFDEVNRYYTKKEMGR